MYILDEEYLINDILSTGILPKDLSIRYLVVLLIRKYIKEIGADNVNIDALDAFVKTNVKKFESISIENYKLHKIIYASYKKILNNELSGDFKKIDFIPIYKSEIDIIKKLKDLKKEKVLFTLYALARYANTNGWVNKKDLNGIREIFSLANVKLYKGNKAHLIYELKRDGFVKLSRNVTNLNIKVDLHEPNEIAYKVTVFNDLGNQYIVAFKSGYKRCQCCGKIFKSIRNKYCKACGVKMKNENSRKRSAEYRSRKKLENVTLV